MLLRLAYAGVKELIRFPHTLRAGTLNSDDVLRYWYFHFMQ